MPACLNSTQTPLPSHTPHPCSTTLSQAIHTPPRSSPLFQSFSSSWMGYPKKTMPSFPSTIPPKEPQVGSPRQGTSKAIPGRTSWHLLFPKALSECRRHWASEKSLWGRGCTELPGALFPVEWRTLKPSTAPENLSITTEHPNPFPSQAGRQAGDSASASFP